MTIIGAGIGGLAAAVDLAARGLDVRVLERAPCVGGKMRHQPSALGSVDAGPTVFTMRGVFDELFEHAGARLADRVDLLPLEVLARHAWQDRPGEHLDLFSEIDRTQDAIGRFCGRADADGYARFARDTEAMFRTLDAPFMRAPRRGPLSLTFAIGLARIGDLLRTRPFTSLWSALGDYFPDPRLRQLFGRYATYCGASPFAAPATLMLIAHAERAGVWRLRGGIHAIARAMHQLALERGASFSLGCAADRIETSAGRVTAVITAHGERIETDAVVVNADAAAVAGGLLGDAVATALARPDPAHRSLSAVTWTGTARTSGFPLAHHSVFFSRDYRAEFDAILGDRRLAQDPTIYVCAQDRTDAGAPLASAGEAERLLVLINAPADGDRRRFTESEISAAREHVLCRLERNGLMLEAGPEELTATTPTEFEQAFPATGGALYGRAVHGFMASFRRPGSRTRIPGLYLAGGSVHPGAGVPMVAISGRLAAASLAEDLCSS
ncbi:MAG TPA: phytoene desaturase family protein [Pseudomonadales bacterium]|nr:phytoene desaturase family protein [Pseudomonadales bacterium]